MYHDCKLLSFHVHYGVAFNYIHMCDINECIVKLENSFMQAGMSNKKYKLFQT